VSLFQFVLFLHVMGAILAFGPTFAFSIIGGIGGKEPQHANFATRVTAAIGTRLVYPLAILQGVTGVALILIGGIDITSRAWLLVGIVLYAIALTFALTIQRSAVNRIIEMTSAPPPPGASGPPPVLVATIRRVQRGGMLTGLLIVAIVFLMVVKPGA
jgi:uncharacterized membrane protein